MPEVTVAHRILAEAGEALASLERDAPLQRIAEIASTALSDFAFVFSENEAGGLVCEGASSREAALQWAVDRMREGGFDAAPPRGVVLARRERKTVMVPLTSETYTDVVSAPRLLEAIHAARPRHALATPMMFGGAVLGVLLIARCEAPFVAADAAIAEEVARRLAVFLENHRLRRAERMVVRARDATLAVVTHDLRGHLRTISLHAQVLARRSPSTEPRILDAASAIREVATRAARLIDDLLDTAMLDAGTLALAMAPLDVGALLEATVALHRASATSRGLTLEVNTDAAARLVLGDARRLAQVFDNLLGNALKFIAAGGVAIAVARRAGEGTVEVADSGPGIAAVDLARVFEPYWTSSSEERRGAGLGLSIAQALVVAHGGTLAVTSEVGLGSTFTVRLPVHDAPDDLGERAGAPV